MNALVKTICTFVTSSIGRKIIVALTGLCLVLFLAGHMAGNLPEWINTYAHGLHSMPEAALWCIRAGLGVIFIIHVWLTIQLKLENNAAREPYVFKNTIKATLSSRYMIYTGLTVLVFLVYHLYQYTLRVGYDPAQFTTFISDGTVETFDVYKMIGRILQRMVLRLLHPGRSDAVQPPAPRCAVHLPDCGRRFPQNPAPLQLCRHRLRRDYLPGLHLRAGLGSSGHHQITINSSQSHD